MADSSFDSDFENASKRCRLASTPTNRSPSHSPSLSTVYEFPIDVDRTIEIGSSGEEPWGNEGWSEDSDGESYRMFPSDDDGYEASSSSDDGMLFPSDTENNSDALTVQGAISCDVQSEFKDVGSTLVGGCCQQQFLLSITPNAVLSA